MFPKPVFEDIQKSNKKRNDAANQPFINNEIEEEEKNINIDNIEKVDNVIFEVLKEKLHDRAVSDVTINKIIRLMNTCKLDMY